jgi:hypothetical protein
MTQIPELATKAITTLRLSMGPRLAATASRHLGCDVKFAYWRKPATDGGPETPVFIVSDEYAERAKAMGLAVLSSEVIAE